MNNADLIKRRLSYPVNVKLEDEEVVEDDDAMAAGFVAEANGTKYIQTTTPPEVASGSVQKIADAEETRSDHSEDGVKRDLDENVVEGLEVGN